MGALEWDIGQCADFRRNIWSRLYVRPRAITLRTCSQNKCPKISGILSIIISKPVGIFAFTSFRSRDLRSCDSTSPN